MDCERELFLLAAFISIALIFVGQSVATAIFGIVNWVLSIFFLRRMGKKDPLMSKVFTRHVKFQTFYSGRSTAWRRQ
jgi:type IV secretory pathway TrbD component